MEVEGKIQQFGGILRIALDILFDLRVAARLIFVSIARGEAHHQIFVFAPAALSASLTGHLHPPPLRLGVRRQHPAQRAAWQEWFSGGYTPSCSWCQVVPLPLSAAGHARTDHTVSGVAQASAPLSPLPVPRAAPPPQRDLRSQYPLVPGASLRRHPGAVCRRPAHPSPAVARASHA